ncbi:response regulator transcription factor [Roseateles sp.]|uniref:response regulator transcription factor n=1 Tax=Roseateles sp. TaxID=1971397 RepID=UPI0031CF7F81
MSVTERSNALAFAAAPGSAGLAAVMSEAVVIHRNPLLRTGLVTALSPFFRARDGAENAPAQTPPMPAPERPPLIVADHDGALAALAAAATQPRRVGTATAHWLVIGAVSHGGRVREAMSAGVLGYVHAACSVEELRDAARAVAAGRRYLCRTAAGLIAEGWLGDDLTPREHDVLRMLCTGLDNKSIGQRLGVAPGTVKTHVKTLLQKLGARSRTQAATEALRRGLIEGSAMDDPCPLPVAA